MTGASEQVGVLAGAVLGQSPRSGLSLYGSVCLGVSRSLPGVGMVVVVRQMRMCTFRSKHLSHYVFNSIAPCLRGILGQM